MGIVRLLLWLTAFAAIAALAFALWSGHRRGQHRRAVDAVLGWTRANVRPGLSLDAAGSALIGQGFYMLIDQGDGGGRADVLFVKELNEFPLLHPVRIEVRLTGDEAGLISAAEHRVL